MASVQEPGTLEFVGVDANGTEHLLLTADVQATGPGGSDTYTPANATQDKWMWFPASNKTFGPGSRFIIYYTPVGVDGIDVSDCFINIPLRVKGVGTVMAMNTDVVSNGGVGSFFESAHTMADVTTVASQRITFYGLRARVGTYWRFGGAKGFLSVEDDT